MQKVVSAWRMMDLRRRLVVVLAALAVVVSVATLARMVTAPSMVLLYAGLENGAAGDIIRALEQQGAVYEVRGGSIFVDATRRDELRMTLASEGLPANGARGYELLDALNGFGTTAQMFDAAYWRAKEGELARTIVSAPHVAQARVHIANANSSPFARSATPTASVALTPAGAAITQAQAKSVQHLVASAVAGLSVDDVTVIDSTGAVLGATEDLTGTSGGSDRGEELRARVARLVEARVGTGNAVVEVSLETITETESIRERRFDPESRVAISTDTEERSNTSTQQADGVTVASNLPDGDAGEGEGSSAQNSETRERVNYEVSETEREVLRAPGAIKRLSVAVLVNGLTEADENGAPVYRDRSEEELEVLRELVASAVGFEEARGDTITIRSLEMPSVLPQGTAVETSLLSGLALNAMSLIQSAILAAVTLILGLFVVRPLLTRSEGAEPGIPALPPVDPSDLSADVLTGEVDFEDSAGGLPVLGDSDWAAVETRGGDPVERLRTLIEERQEETVEILRDWLEEGGKTV